MAAAVMVGETSRTSLDGSSDASDDSGWLDVEPDEERGEAVISLFDSQSFPALDEMLGHCKRNHGFDLVANMRRLRLDFLGAVKLVNYIRSRVQLGQPLPDVISQSDIDDDVYLKPVLDNDAVLFSLGDVLEAADDVADATDEQTRALLARNRQLEAELEAIQSSFANYRLTVQQTLDRRWGDDNQDSTPAEASCATVKEPNSDYYFESYATHGISHQAFHLLPAFSPLTRDTDPRQISTKPCSKTRSARMHIAISSTKISTCSRAKWSLTLAVAQVRLLAGVASLMPSSSSLPSPPQPYLVAT